MADKVIGKNIVLYYHDPVANTDIAFACSTTSSFSVSVDQKEVTSQTSAWYKEFRNDIASWQMTCEGLVTLDGYGYLFLLQQQQTRTTITTKFVINNGADGLVVISGTCNLTNIQINAPYKDIGTYSVQLQGTGAYGTTGTTITPAGTVITAGGVTYRKEYLGTGGESTITFTDMVSKTCLEVTRGGTAVASIVTTTPTGEQVRWNTSTGVLTFARVLSAGEQITILFQ